MKIIGRVSGTERIVTMTTGEIDNLQWVEGIGYNDRKQDVGVSVNIHVVKDAIKSVKDMQEYKKEIRSMLAKFKKLAGLLDDRTEMDKK